MSWSPMFFEAFQGAVVLLGATVASFLLFDLYTFIVRSKHPKIHTDKLSKEIALVTGGANGLGKELALSLLDCGCRVVVWDYNEKALSCLREENSAAVKSGRLFCYQVDVGDHETVQNSAKLVKSQVGNVSILINNAGVLSAKPFLELTEKQIINSFRVNTFSHYWTLKAFLPEMLLQNYGSIVNIASVLGHMGVYHCSDYCATKFAAVGFFESLRLELASYDGICPILVCPATISTQMFSGLKQYVFPALSPKYVALEVVNAIASRKSGTLFIPRIFHLILTVFRVLPFSFSLFFAKLTRTDRALDQVKGTHIF